MPLPLPNLDDRRWADLVDEGQALIPFYSADWTDHNIHDPGITLIDLLAWFTEMDLYQLNQIPEEHKRKFLALVGVRPRPGQPARAVLSFRIGSGGSLELPEGIVFESSVSLGVLTRFRTLNSFTVIPGDLVALQTEDQQRFTDLTERWQNGEPMQVFGNDPSVGTALYLGFAQPLPVDHWTSLFLLLSDLSLVASDEERERLENEESLRASACRPPHAVVSCNEFLESQSVKYPETKHIRHHSVQLVWEYFGPDGRWHVLDAASGVLIDETRAFTLNGRVLLRPPLAMRKTRIGQIQEDHYYLRCRLTGGFYDAAPNLQTIVFNGALAEQAILPQKTRQQTVRQEKTWIKLLRKGDGTPLQKVPLFDETDDGTNPSEYTVVESSVRVFTIEANDWKEWVLRPDFDSSTPADFHFLLDSRELLITFGDGDKGRMVPKDVEIYATYLLTRAASGNVPARSITQIAAISHNQGISAEAYSDIKNRLSEITNPLAAEGGVRAETVSDAAARAILARDQTPRAVTLEDYERLAKRTPGIRLARVFARANLHPSFPCFDALGVVTVVVVSFLPRKKPTAGLNLCRKVADYLNRRRIVGTRVEVVGPTYVAVTVKAQVRAIRGVDHLQLRQRLVLALNAFFDPLTGGPEHHGWPFGRDVYRSEVLQVLDEQPGVEHVLSLELIDGSGKARCSNVCLSPTDLVAAGNHQIDVM